ncbi:MAG TPA: CmpA/NrtA family ABC transporter substrate-binding protein [Opitutaceae bacterium]|nr:CmpA/NrtA family ABC transporter substrate-binding protein [Opitutaceae bacterium]
MSFVPGTAVTTKSIRRSPRLRVGFLALTDAAPFAVAQELGLFQKHGIEVELSREVGWATIREKIIYGELDAAQCLAPMLWSTFLGIDSVACRVLSGLILSMRGNALTLSNRLWDAGVRDAVTLRDEARRRVGERKLTLGVVFTHSSHNLLLRSWLKSGGINPDRDVRIVVVPPAQMFRNLSAGTIDGYCSGEPWNTAAVEAGIGWCPTWSAAHSLSPIEKVLMVTERFVESNPAEHQKLIAALLEACAWCDELKNREALPELLSSRNYLQQSAEVIRPSLSGHFACGYGKIEYVPGFHVFHADNANAPTAQKAERLQKELREAGLLESASLPLDLPRQLFREDIYASAMQMLPHELVSS